MSGNSNRPQFAPVSASQQGESRQVQWCKSSDYALAGQSVGFWKGFWQITSREFFAETRRKSAWATLLLFFLLVLILLPFAIGPDPVLLRRLGPGLIWLAAVLMTLLALDGLFLADYRDGTLDIMLLSALPLPLLVGAKLLAYGGLMLFSLLGMLLPATLFLGMPLKILPVLAITFGLGLPVLLALGGVMAAVALAVRRGVALLTLLLTPFYVPVLIFAVGAVDKASMGFSPLADILLLAALAVVTVTLSPFLIAAALKQAQG